MKPVEVEEELEGLASRTSLHPLYHSDTFKGVTERPEARPTLADIYPQVVAACISLTLVIQAGANMAYSAILLPQLNAPHSTFRVEKDEESWIASLLALATPVGALLCGPFMDLLGRKLFSLVTTVPLTLSWLFTAFTPNSVLLLYLARILAGLGGGMTTVSLVYISEVSDTTWRPMLLSLNSVFVSLGILLTNALGVSLPWRVVAAGYAVLTVLSASTIAIIIPESPVWLLTFHPHSEVHLDRAKQSLHHLYPKQQMFKKEWNRLMVVQAQGSEKDEGEGLLFQLKTTAGKFTKRTSYLPILLLITLFVFQQLSGTYAIIFYAVQVFQSIERGCGGGGGLTADSATVILGVMRFVVSLLTAVLSRSCGRRALMTVSGVGMTVTALFTAVYFHQACVFSEIVDAHTNLIVNGSFTSSSNLTTLMTPGEICHSYSGVIVVLSLLLFVTFGSLGMLIIPWTLVGEIVPTAVRGVSSGFLIAFAYILMFIVVKIFPFMIEVFKISSIFYFFSSIAFLNVIVVYLFAPETLGKSFDEIEQWFKARDSID